ncbi:beta-tubulin [Apiospora arundinis]
MDSKIFNVNPGEHIPGNVLHEYSIQYAERFDVLQAIRYSHRVATVEHRGGPEGGWTLTTQDTAGSAARFVAKKLVTATGLTSQAFHAGLQRPGRIQLFGGTKSSWDAVYAYAIKGVHVDWVIRETGHGPVWMSPPYVTPLKIWLEKLVRNDVITLNQYDKHPEVKKLKLSSQAMFTASSFSILNYPTDFFDLVKNGTVTIHIADIDHLSPQTVHLSNGISFQTDAFMSTTGWRHAQSIKYMPEGIDMQLGIPIASTTLGNARGCPDLDNQSRRQCRPRNSLPLPPTQESAAQNKTLQPLLATPGVSSNQDDATVPSVQSYTATPYHLYRFMVPVAEHLLRFRDIAFAGAMMNFSVAPIVHLQSLWINAYFHDKLPARVLPPLSPCTWAEEQDESKGLDELRYETVLHARFGKWRYPAGHGAQFPDFVFDALPYMDLLVGDLGLALYKLNLGLAVVVAAALGALDRYNRGLGDAVAGKAGHRPELQACERRSGCPRAGPYSGAAHLEVAEKPRHAWHAGADDADIEVPPATTPPASHSPFVRVVLRVQSMRA